MSEVLKGRLAEFSRAMLAEFQAASPKHPGPKHKTRDVADDATDWARLDFLAVYEHFLREVEDARGNLNSPKEWTDVSNLAFLMWWRATNGEKLP